MHIRIPEGSALYVFGSARWSKVPRDLDVLVVYDITTCLPEDAYMHHQEMLADLGVHFGLPVHATFLTPSEEVGTAFIARTAAVPLNHVARRGLTRA
jgi:hypothetical protein